MPNKKEEIVLLFASNLRRLRKEKGLTLRDLEANCKIINNSDLSRYEHADTNISIVKLDEIAKGLGIEADELIRRPKA